jgi:hypothetical protein
VVLVWDATQGGSPKQSMHAQHADNSAMANWSLQNLQRRTGDQLSIAIAAQRLGSSLGSCALRPVAPAFKPQGAQQNSERPYAVLQHRACVFGHMTWANAAFSGYPSITVNRPKSLQRYFSVTCWFAMHTRKKRRTPAPRDL